jgi:hypothetical protein
MDIDTLIVHCNIIENSGRTGRARVSRELYEEHPCTGI